METMQLIDAARQHVCIENNNLQKRKYYYSTFIITAWDRSSCAKNNMTLYGYYCINNGNFYILNAEDSDINEKFKNTLLEDIKTSNEYMYPEMFWYNSNYGTIQNKIYQILPILKNKLQEKRLSLSILKVLNEITFILPTEFKANMITDMSSRIGSITYLTE